MVSCQWLKQVSRNSANWNVAQRQVQQKQSLIAQQTFIDYQQSLAAVVDKGLTSIRFNTQLCDRLRKLTDYNVASGKQIRGLLTITACEALVMPEEKEKLQQKMFALAWAVEMFHAFFLMTDDMEDGAKTRRGKACWHLLPEVGVYAINDTGMFRSFISEIISQYFSKEDVYPKLVNIFNEAYFKTHVGQFIDTTLCKERNYLSLTKDKYNTLVKYKTSFYSFQLPILLGLALSNKYTENAYQIVESICTDVGLLLQMQNDFLDFYDDESVGGKSGTDIQEGKCTWLALTALTHCNQSQLALFLENYGKFETECVNKIRMLYNELDLTKICTNEQKHLYDSIHERINNLKNNSTPPGVLFVKLVNMINTVGNINYGAEL